MDNSKVKQQLSQALSNTEGLTTYVKGYLQCVDERIALDGRPLASAANVDGLIQDILDNDRANKDKLAIIKRELLRKIKQKTKLQFFVQIMQKRTEELIQQGAAIKEVGKVWPQLGPDVDFSGMLSSMQSVADGEKDKVAEKENELAVLRQELNSLQDGQKPGVKLPESKTMVGVQVHVMDKQDCRDDLKKAEKSWLRQVSTTLEYFLHVCYKAGCPLILGFLPFLAMKLRQLFASAN